LAIFVHHLFKKRLNLKQVSDIGFYRMSCRRTSALRQVRDFGSRLHSDVGNANSCALFSEQQRNCATNVRGAASDDDDLFASSRFIFSQYRVQKVFAIYIFSWALASLAWLFMLTHV